MEDFEGLAQINGWTLGVFYPAFGKISGEAYCPWQHDLLGLRSGETRLPVDAARGDVPSPREQCLCRQSGVAGVKAAPEMLYAFILDLWERSHLRRD